MLFHPEFRVRMDVAADSGEFLLIQAGTIERAWSSEDPGLWSPQTITRPKAETSCGVFVRGLLRQ